MADSQRLLLGIKQVAAVLGVSESTILRRAQDKSIPSRKIGGLVKIHQDDLNRIVEHGYALPQHDQTEEIELTQD